MKNSVNKVELVEKLVMQEKLQNPKDNPKVSPGDTVKVHVKIKEGDKERIQIFEGTVIALNNSGSRRTFTVRKISHGVGVERVFPLYSPSIARVERIDSGTVRRAKLYYIRKLAGKAAKLRSSEATGSSSEA